MNKGISPLVLRIIEKLVFQHQELLQEKFHDYHHH